MSKKTIFELRQEFIEAEHELDVLHIYGDHIVIVFPYSMIDIDRKKQELKEYIQTNFQKVLNVDVFTQYIVIWHDHELLDQRHIRCKRPTYE